MFEGKMKKCITLLILLMSSSNALAQSSSLNLAIPQSPQSYQSDRVRAGDLECSAAIGSSTNLEFGVVGILNQNDPYQPNPYNDPALRNEDGFVRDVGVYARMQIPIGAPKQRLDCTKLYRIEIEKKQLELIKLRQEIKNLQSLKFEEE
jgi:hypothetical protein